MDLDRPIMFAQNYDGRRFYSLKSDTRGSPIRSTATVPVDMVPSDFLVVSRKEADTQPNSNGGNDSHERESEREREAPSKNGEISAGK